MNQIFKVIAIIIFTISIQHKLQAQTLVPFYDIGSTSVLPNSTSIQQGEAHMRIGYTLANRKATYEKDYKNYKGQYYFKNDLVINIRAQRLPPKPSRYKILTSWKGDLDDFFSHRKSRNDFFSAINKVNNYYVLVSYTLNDNTSKDAFIVDEEGKYLVTVQIYSRDTPTAIQQGIDMINQIANTITFIVE